MSTVITLEDIRAYAEVDYIINHVNVKYQEMVPEKLKRFFSEYKNPNIQVKVNPYIPLQSQGLSRYALELIALIHLKYWCEDEERKEELYEAMIRNQEKIDASMKDRFDVDSLFVEKEEEKPFENEDFSKPREIQTVEIPAKEEEEPIVEESSEVVEGTFDEEPAVENQDDNHPTNNEQDGNVISKIINSIKDFFISIFGK